MLDPRSVARERGIAIELADLGAWGGATLVSEYDPAGPLIRINTQAIPHGSAGAVRAHVDRAVTHELYHHREAMGEIARLAQHAARERAAAEHRER